MAVIFRHFICSFKNLNFLCIAKIKKPIANEAEGFLAKIFEKIWRLKKIVYFCSPKIRE